jgi:hypothetical protein
MKATRAGTSARLALAWSVPRFAKAINAPKKDLRLFTPEEGATEHCGLDHLPHVAAYTADWIEDTLRELDA